MTAPITFVRLYNTSQSWIIATSWEDSAAPSSISNMMLISSDGLFTPGENDAEAVERTYSNGSVLPPKPRFSGLDFSLEFLFYSLNRDVDIKAMMRSFIHFLQSDSIFLETDWPHFLTVQTQRIDLSREDWAGKGRAALKVFFKASTHY